VLKIRRQKSFLKDLSKITMTNSHYAKYLVYLVTLLSKELLPKEAKDHALLGEWKDTREFHN